MNLTDVSIKNPVFAWMLMACAILFGIVAVTRIGISQYPDVDYPNISVSVSWSGASPSAVEREIIEPLEQSLAQVEGIQQMTSSARQGSARITATFDISRNVDLALQDVQARVAQVQRQLPKDVSSPTVSKSNPDDTPILTIGVSGPFSPQLLSDVARYQVQEKLQTVAGVGQITLSGSLSRNVRIWLDASRLAEKGVVANDVIGAVQREHLEVPGGQLEAGGRQLSVRLLGEALKLDELRKLVVRRVNNTPVYLEDVALVEDGFEDVTTIARLDGVPLQALGVLKQRGTNAVAVATGVREKVAEIQKSLPEGMKVEVLFDTTTFIEESVHHIELEIGLALILTALVCWLFLGSLSSTLNVVLAIPMSLLGTVAVIYFLGFTLNTFTLLGLSLAVGLVVDDAVMVMENIYRHAEMGKPRARAAAEGTKEITFAALAATLAVVAIFLPVIFMEGVIGRFFFQFGVTLSIAVMLSYFEAITLAPARCAQILSTSREGRSRIGLAVDKAFARLEGGYAWALGGAVRHPWKVLFGSLVMLGATVLAVPYIATEFVPSQDQSRLNVRIQTETGTSISAAAPLIDRAEALLAKRPEVLRVLTTLSGSSGSIQLTLVPPEERKLSAQLLMADLRKDLQGIAGIRASVQDPSQQGFGIQQGSPVSFTVRGGDWDKLVAAALKIQEDLEATGIVTDLRSDYQVGNPEVQVVPDRRRANDIGVTVSDIANTVSALVGGNIVGKFATEGRRIDIRMRLLAAQRSRPEDLGAIRMRAQNGETIPLSLMTTQQEVSVLQAISRVDRERAISISANVAPGHSQAEAMAKVEELSRDMPIGYRTVASGQASQLSETTSGLVFALLIGILVAYMVLASQFNSFLDPVTVLTILPLALSGAALGLLVSGKTLNIFSMIGVLLLMGIVKKNSILLVEYANQVHEEEGLPSLPAMLKAGPLRLRPILMTTIATMMAAVPPILGIGSGTETRSPMAAVVLGGLTVSTVLSLFVVPAFYVVTNRAKERMRRKPAAGDVGGDGHGHGHGHGHAPTLHDPGVSA
ncbi:efflux RND transporter permease subunit [Chondromyces apiculatus]|uniref:RND multidrug efflux transporter / Acriflavin resistance protein n=1 Tax=Chondromyces apiculatus DSM 436 TaxID=1192034 RepID=A0A017T3G5_9BACT|nr:efflux RND transporter permease subunit [Chondromyces apiculatus]EYF03799.1 RND multidrug efflux transporter / Acriflavin resistance protein [Chondromyces apiculatus DSM 436]